MKFPKEDSPFTPHSDISQLARSVDTRLRARETFYLERPLIANLLAYYRSASAYAEAIRLTEYACSIYPSDWSLYVAAATFLYLDGQLESAIEMLNRAWVSGGRTCEVARKLAYLHAESERPDRSADVLGVLLREHPDTYEALLVFAEFWLDHGEPVKACDYLIAAVDAVPNPEAALRLMVEGFSRISTPLPAAAAFLEQYTAANPDSAPAYLALSFLYLRSEQLCAAERALACALALSPSADGYLAFAELHLRRGQEGLALRALLNAVVQEPERIDVLLALADCYYGLRQFGRARFYFIRCTRVAPECTEAWIGVGKTLLAEERFYEAGPNFNRALSLDDECADAWLGLAEAEFRLGNAVSAFDALMKAFRFDQSNGTIWSTWACRMDESGDTEAAYYLLQQGMIIHLENSRLFYHAALLAFKLNYSAEAYSLLENALLMDFDGHIVLHELSPEVASLRPIRELIAQYRP
jgi:tetratricopeptide (TPR) repeat protein